MKNSEYNKVKVTNENAKNVPEFVGTPKVESAAYFESSKAYKDELNSRRTNNDKIEEIGVNSKKKNGFAKQQDFKKVQHGPTHLASTAGHTVVAATTVSVTAIAVVVIGTTIIDEYVEELDPIVYLESDIGTDSISFRFTIPNRLLGYYQEDTPETQEFYDYTKIKAMVYNENYKDDQYVEEIGSFEDDPDNYSEGWMGFYDLIPNTNYTLCIYLEHTRMYPDTQMEEFLGTDNLSYRTFSTKPIPNYVEFVYLEGDSSSVSFEYRVSPTVIGATPGDLQPNPDQLAMYVEITDAEGYWDQVFVDNIQKERETDYLRCFGSFSGLHPSTTYTLKVYQSREQEYALLGQTKYTSGSSIGHFDTPSTMPTEIFVPLIVPNEYASNGESPAGTVNSVYVTIDDYASYTMTYYCSDFNTYDDSHSICGVSFSNLYPDTQYRLIAYANIANDNIILAETAVRTNPSEAEFMGITIDPEASFYSHQFTATLSYKDDGSVFGDFVLTFKDSNYNELGTIPMEATTEPQLLEVGQSGAQGQAEYDFYLGSVAYYTLTAYNDDYETTQTLVDNEAFTFSDTDVTGFNGVNSPYIVQLSPTTGSECVMPVKLDFVDDAHNYGEQFTIEISNTNLTMTATLERSTEWQYANLTGQYISRYMGEEFDVTIYDGNGNPQCLISNQTVDQNSSTNEIYGVKLTYLNNNNLNFDENNLTFDFQAYYLFADDSAGSMQLIFQDSTDSSYEFTFTMSVSSYPSDQVGSCLLSEPFDGPAGTSYETYSDIVNAYGNRSFDVYARYYTRDGSIHTPILVYEGVTFSFE